MSCTLPPGIRLEKDVHGLDRLVIETQAVSAIVYRHGAHLTHWQPRGHEPVLWMSGKSHFAHDKPIRGGVPICFPWFGPNAGDPKLPMHGFARTAPWELASATVAAGEAVLTLTLDNDLHTRALWPFDFDAALELRLGATLTMSLSVRNAGDKPMTLEQALHTYLAVGDVRQVRVGGLDGVTYIDKTDNFQRKTQADGVTISGETDRVYLHTTAATTLEDPSMRRRITVDKSGSQTTVVWNPWVSKAKAMADFGDEEWPGMICIETCNAADNAVTIMPDERRTMTAKLSVEDI